MPEVPSIDEILAANPHIDHKELAKAIEMLRKLRESGASRFGYRLAPPYSRRHITVGGDDNSRTVHLGRSPRT